MKKTILLLIATIFLTALAYTQTRGTLYRANQWIDCNEMGGKFNPALFDKAMENPIFEKVEILVTDKFIKATFGTKIYKYSILSIKEKSASEVTTYFVSLGNKKYELSISDMSLINQGTAIGLEGYWFVFGIKNIQQVQLK